MSTMNKLANCTNPYQGTAKKVLCLCSAGLLRSPTTAKVLAEEYGYNTRAAGVNREYALIDISDVLVKWADEIVVMEKWMLNEVIKFDTENKPLVCLDIEDEYAWNDLALRQEVKTKYDEYLDNQ